MSLRNQPNYPWDTDSYYTPSTPFAPTEGYGIDQGFKPEIPTAANQVQFDQEKEPYNPFINDIFQENTQQMDTQYPQNQQLNQPMMQYQSHYQMPGYPYPQSQYQQYQMPSYSNVHQIPGYHIPGQFTKYQFPGQMGGYPNQYQQLSPAYANPYQYTNPSYLQQGQMPIMGYQGQPYSYPGYPH